MTGSLESMLMKLGLSGLEAEVYLAVLSEPGITGYRVSQILGKAAPNTYKALNSLVVKGALLSDNGNRSRTYSAVAVRELTAQMTRKLSILTDDIEIEIGKLHTPVTDEGVYDLTSIDQVIAKSRKIISEARDSIIVDADYNPIIELASDLEEAASRGVHVLIHGRKPMQLKGCEFISSITEEWEGNLLVLAADGKEYLISFMSNDMRTLLRAVWSNNFIAPCIYRGYMIKAVFYKISMMLGSRDTSIDEIRNEILRLWEIWGYGESDKGAFVSMLNPPGV